MTTQTFKDPCAFRCEQYPKCKCATAPSKFTTLLVEDTERPLSFAETITTLNKMLEDVCDQNDKLKAGLAEMKNTAQVETEACAKHHARAKELEFIIGGGNARKWHTQFHRPPVAELQFSEEVLIYSPAYKMHAIGWFDFELDKWHYTGEAELKDFIWTSLRDLKPQTAKQ